MYSNIKNDNAMNWKYYKILKLNTDVKIEIHGLDCLGCFISPTTPLAAHMLFVSNKII